MCTLYTEYNSIKQICGRVYHIDGKHDVEVVSSSKVENRGQSNGNTSIIVLQ